MKTFDDNAKPTKVSKHDFLTDKQIAEIENQANEKGVHDRPDRPDRHGFRVACVRNDIWECCFTLPQARALVQSHKDSTGHEVGILGSCTIPGP